MKKEKFEAYINRFNNRDSSFFENFVHSNAKTINGTPEIFSLRGMKDRYARTRKGFSEELHVQLFVSDERPLAIQIRTHITARENDIEFLFGPVKAGETFNYHGVTLYEQKDDSFARSK